MKREISKTMSGSEVPLIRTESAFDITCCRCERVGEAREIKIQLPKAFGKQLPVKWNRLPEGWWLQDGLFDLVMTCPGCMEPPPLPAATESPTSSETPPLFPDEKSEAHSEPRTENATATLESVEPSLADILFPPAMRPVLADFIRMRKAVRDGDRQCIRLLRLTLRSRLENLESDAVPGLLEASARLEEAPVEAITPAFMDALVPLLFDAKKPEVEAPPRLDRRTAVTDYLRRTLDEALAQLDDPRTLRANLEQSRIRQALDVNEPVIRAQQRILETALAIPPDALQALLASPIEAVRTWAQATLDLAELV